jgi:hypothetical protein
LVAFLEEEKKESFEEKEPMVVTCLVGWLVGCLVVLAGDDESKDDE